MPGMMDTILNLGLNEEGNQLLHQEMLVGLGTATEDLSRCTLT
ncbi:MAG: hypothetical protein ACLTCI_08820 [[Clostridium] nexile]